MGSSLCDISALSQHPLTLYFLRYQLNLHNDPQEKKKKKPIVLRMGNAEIQDASVMSGRREGGRGFCKPTSAHNGTILSSHTSWGPILHITELGHSSSHWDPALLHLELSVKQWLGSPR